MTEVRQLKLIGRLLGLAILAYLQVVLLVQETPADGLPHSLEAHAVHLIEQNLNEHHGDTRSISPALEWTYLLLFESDRERAITFIDLSTVFTALAVVPQAVLHLQRTDGLTDEFVIFGIQQSRGPGPNALPVSRVQGRIQRGVESEDVWPLALQQADGRVGANHRSMILVARHGGT